jgi:3-dehydroquinate dehydratase
VTGFQAIFYVCVRFASFVVVVARIVLYIIIKERRREREFRKVSYSSAAARAEVNAFGLLAGFFCR